jgi:hypothetical protein
MTRTGTLTEAPVCRRCHGSGHEPAGPDYNIQQRGLIDTLRELGDERAALQRRRAYMTTNGRKRYNEVLTQIRSTVAAAGELGIRNQDMEDALGLSSTALFNIRSGKTGK